MNKKAEKLTLTTIVEAVLVAGALFVLFILSVGLYNLFFHDSSEQNAKQTFESLITRLELLKDNKPIRHNMILPKGYAIMDTETFGECYFGKIKNKDEEMTGKPLYAESLPEICNGKDCFCLCKSETIGLCNEIIQCKVIDNKQSEDNNDNKVYYYSKVEPDSNVNFEITSKAAIEKDKIYSCVYIPGKEKTQTILGIVKSGNELLLCQNQCNPNDPNCCQTENFKKVNQEKFNKLKQSFEKCKENTIEKSNELTTLNYMKALHQATYVSEIIDFLPYIAGQKTLYQYVFDEAGNLAQEQFYNKIKLPIDKFHVIKGDISIIECENINDNSYNPTLNSREFKGNDNINRLIQLGKCEDTNNQPKFFIRIIKHEQQNALYVNTDLPMHIYNLILDGTIQLVMIDDNLFVIPNKYLLSSTDPEFNKIEESSSMKYIIPTNNMNERININSNEKETDLKLNSGYLLNLNNNFIPIINNHAKPSLIQKEQQITKCDQLDDISLNGEYIYFQGKSQDGAKGNDFNIIIELGSCEKQEFTEDEITAQKQNIAYNCNPSEDGSDCPAGSTASPEIQAEIFIKHYIRVIKQEDSGNKIILYKNEQRDSLQEDITKQFYFYNDYIYILSPSSEQLTYDKLYKLNLITKQKSPIILAIDLKTIDTEKLPKPSSCKPEFYDFSDNTKLNIKTDGSAILSVNYQKIMDFQFSDLPYADDNLFCITDDLEKTKNILKQEITFEANSLLSFVDIGIDRMCLYVNNN